MDLSALTGWVGATLVLLAFYVTVLGDWKPDSGRYMALSNLAALLLVANAWMNEAYPFLVVNLALMLVTAYTLYTKGKPKWR